MGNKKQTFRLKWQVYATNGLLAIIVGIVYSIFQYTREFFTMYASINHLFMFLQWVCIGLIIGLVGIIVLQYKKAGCYTFYDNGFVDEHNNVTYLYHDIMSYTFIPQNNKQAKLLQFTTDSNQEVTLSALLSAQAFELFQEGHAAIWGPFLIQKIDAKQIMTFRVLDDVTSFKFKEIESKEDDKQLSISHEGIVLYGKFYQWSKLSRFEVSFTGMMSIKDTNHKTIWLEPIVCIESYYDVIYLLHHYFARKEEVYEKN